MDVRVKQLVQESWMQVEPIADTAATLFYDRLFELDPALRPLFPATDLRDQKKKLMQTLTVAVRGLYRLEELAPALEALGRRHVGYGVQDAHYETVGQALLWTLEQGLGAAFTPEVRDAWAETYALVTSVMQRAARESAEETTLLRAAA
ncbi:globin family protein [Longimicrobium sp.]|uniref:globin family protein n=1 Tax=Longimicrobium sp. TaxID=2029185 RepID=UPI003B3B7BCE